MNLLTTSQRDFLPPEKKKIVEQRERLFSYKKKIALFAFSCFILVGALILFPQIIRQTIPPIYGTYHIDPVIKEGYVVKKLSGQDLASALLSNNIQNPQLTSSSQLAELIVKPQVQEESVTNADNRVVKLHNFLVAQGSPAAGSAATFVNVADEYGIDWRLLPSIAGTESGFCKLIPIQADGQLSYNCFGFGVYGGSFISFSSFDNAIENVAKNLVATYGVKNMQPDVMEATYCPPCTADHHWERTVSLFMSEL